MQRRIQPHCTLGDFLTLQFFITVASNSASERSSFKQTTGTKDFQNCISLPKYACLQKKLHTHTHTPKLSKQNYLLLLLK